MKLKPNKADIMISKDITVKVSDGKFNYRVGAILIDSGEILMVKNQDSHFYYTVGGRVQFGESLHEAILREVYEETKIRIEIGHLAFIHENFFTLESDGEFYHEVSLFFLMKPHKGLREATGGSFREEYGDVSFHWLPINEIGNYHIYPEFFRSELLGMTADVKHFVTRNEITLPVHGIV